VNFCIHWPWDLCVCFDRKHSLSPHCLEAIFQRRGRHAEGEIGLLFTASFSLFQIICLADGQLHHHKEVPIGRAGWNPAIGLFIEMVVGVLLLHNENRRWRRCTCEKAPYMTHSQPILPIFQAFCLGLFSARKFL